VGVAQWLEQADLGWQRLGEYELDPAWNGVSIVWAQTGRALRAYGLSDHPNILGGLLAFGLILLLAWYVSEARAGGAGRTLAAGVIILGLGGLLVTFSRSAWLAFASGIGLAALLLFRKRRTRPLLDGATLLVTALMVLSPLIWQALPYLGVRFNAGGSFERVPYEQGSLVERAALNQAANAIFARHALTGVGLGAYPAALQQAEPDFIFNYQPPHLVMLAAAAETGLFGALFYFLALAAPWLALWLNRRRVALAPEQLGAIGLVLAVSVVGLFDYYPWLLAPGRFWAWLAWGLWAAAFPRSIPKD
jgi:O-antigen ligase